MKFWLKENKLKKSFGTLKLVKIQIWPILEKWFYEMLEFWARKLGAQFKFWVFGTLKNQLLGNFGGVIFKYHWNFDLANVLKIYLQVFGTHKNWNLGKFTLWNASKWKLLPSKFNVKRNFDCLESTKMNFTHFCFSETSKIRNSAHSESDKKAYLHLGHCRIFDKKWSPRPVFFQEPYSEWVTFVPWMLKHLMVN